MGVLPSGVLPRTIERSDRRVTDDHSFHTQIMTCRHRRGQVQVGTVASAANQKHSVASEARLPPCLLPAQPLNPWARSHVTRDGFTPVNARLGAPAKPPIVE